MVVNCFVCKLKILYYNFAHVYGELGSTFLLIQILTVAKKLLHKVATRYYEINVSYYKDFIKVINLFSTFSQIFLAYFRNYVSAINGIHSTKFCKSLKWHQVVGATA